MYDELKLEMSEKRDKLDRVQEAIEKVVRSGFIFDGKTVRHFFDISNNWIIDVTNNYIELKDVIQTISSTFKVPLHFKMSWPAGTNKQIMFSWGTKKIPISIWGRFDWDKVPNELKGDCEVKLVEKIESNYRLVCGV